MRSCLMRIRCGKPGGAKPPLIQEEKSGTLGINNDQTLFCLNDQGGTVMGVSHDVSGTLRAQEHGHQPVVMAFDTTQITSKQNESIPDFGKPCHTLNANAHVPCAVLDMNRQTPRTYQMQGFGDYREGDVASSCKQRDYKDSTDLVCSVDCRNFTEGGEINGTLQAKESGGQSLNLNNTVRQNMVVRRLTPLECTRLQGFPDGWVDIGDWVDTKGKKHKDADSPKYKALGNSIALPFWRWMFRRMAEYLPEKAALGSLFDGIGGFPKCWEDVHGAGTALWASEIEKFPIAVTKTRFPGMEHLGDITKLNGAELKPVHAVAGGSPCQDLSTAGKRKGLAGERSGLFMEQIRVVKEMRESSEQSGADEPVWPRYMVWENVPGALSCNGGRDFAAVLEETIRIADPEAPGIDVPAKGWPNWGATGTWMEDGQWLGECMTRNFGESPSVAAESRLSQILEAAPPMKYCLSAKACQGILNRAQRRGKELPTALRDALIRQSKIM